MSATHCSSLVNAILNAIDGFALNEARVRVAELVNCVGPLNGGLTNDEARILLEKLLKKRWFDIADPLADAFTQIPSASAELRRRCAQVMLERGRYGPALRILLALRKTRGGDQAEVLGHIGRIRKQQFVESIEQGNADLRLLELATRIYLDAYKEDRTNRTWHGINAVALLRYGESMLSHASGFVGEDSSQLAREILHIVSTLPTRHFWDLGTAAEAALALGDYDATVSWLQQYNSVADAFALGATLRQLEQIWRLPELGDPTTQMLLDLQRAALLQKTNANIPITIRDINRFRATVAQLEAVFGADSYDSLENYRRGLDRCACVARIGRTSESGVGTGFVVPAELLGLMSEKAFVLVTNAHVISEEESERNRGALHPSEAVVTFAAIPNVSPNREFQIKKILYSSGREELDVTVVQLSPEIPDITAYPVAPVPPARESKAQVRVIGHPSGRGLSLSVNELLDHQSPRIHYRTATEGGSSGSPVFNQEWKLIALHHAGGQAVLKLNSQEGSYQANEGILIGAIRQGIEQAISA